MQNTMKLDVLVVGMASSRGAIEEAVAEFDQEGVKVNHLQLAFD